MYSSKIWNNTNTNWNRSLHNAHTESNCLCHRSRIIFPHSIIIIKVEGLSNNIKTLQDREQLHYLDIFLVKETEGMSLLWGEPGFFGLMFGKESHMGCWAHTQKQTLTIPAAITLTIWVLAIQRLCIVAAVSILATYIPDDEKL